MYLGWSRNPRLWELTSKKVNDKFCLYSTRGLHAPSGGGVWHFCAAFSRLVLKAHDLSHVHGTGEVEVHQIIMKIWIFHTCMIKCWLQRSPSCSVIASSHRLTQLQWDQHSQPSSHHGISAVAKFKKRQKYKWWRRGNPLDNPTKFTHLYY